MEQQQQQGRLDRVTRAFNTTVFFGLHVLAISLALHTGVSASALALFAVTSAALLFGITAGYHRYFSHRTFQTSRAFQFVLALLGTLALQKGVLWWASHHRRHHRESDQEGDVHSPVRRGFWWAHLGWILVPDWEATDLDGIKDMAVYPELRWLNQHYLLPPLGLSVLVGCTLGAQHLAWGCFMSTMVVGHATFCVNSLAHLVGARVYETSDHSRNNWALALLTFGEGWHNNHHFFPASARQGFRWWEVDVTYYVLCLLERLGVVWGVRRPAAEIVAGWLGGKNHLVVRAAAAPVDVDAG
ncbi:MAG: fatty acid desaturase [Planctomycetes bacterium]|nr:fatty acid desaturase [Planctomycetota bacterium]